MFTPLNFSKKTSGVDLTGLYPVKCLFIYISLGPFYFYLTGEVQLVNYLNGLKKDIRLLINFSPSGVEIKRKYPTPNREI